MINNSPNGVPEFYNMLYLLVHRPLFIAGFTMVIFPTLIADKSSPCRPGRDFLSHAFWVPFSRLTYGALISHGIWMQFREFNTERGTWGSGLDAFLFFLAYLTFSFLFSFVTAMIWEQPVATLWFEFVQKPMMQESARGETYYQAAPSAAGATTTSSSDKVSSIQDVIASKKAKLLGGDDSGDAKRRRNQVEEDAEDLEGDQDSNEGSPSPKKKYTYKPKQ